ncbi:MAG: hypothetical protein CM1200mP26_02950 [Acidimicrobiales bacterium]|nr:MAG: hypothetical protein CM1200mP26_02950 [Acidimicrobiales bacterium]
MARWARCRSDRHRRVWDRRGHDRRKGVANLYKVDLVDSNHPEGVGIGASWYPVSGPHVHDVVPGVVDLEHQREVGGGLAPPWRATV